MSLWSLLYRFMNPPVKESMDELPAGICCYWPGGIVKLKNRTMESLSFALFGESLMDGEGFWRSLTAGTGTAEFLRTGEESAVRLPDGTVRGFSHREARLDGRVLYIVTAIDLTEAYRRNAELTEKQTRAAAMVARQRALNREIGSMIREREILELKTRVHDDLSRALLSGRQYLARPEEDRRRELLRLWEQSMHILRHEGPDEWRDSYENALETARAFGISLAVEGQVPPEPGPRRLVSSALVCCLSNAVRHAGADRVTLRVARTESGYDAELTNNGAPPEAPVAETGGLADLRKQVEAAGGSMKIRSAPGFALAITIQREGKGYGISGIAGRRPEDGADAAGIHH